MSGLIPSKDLPPNFALRRSMGRKMMGGDGGNEQRGAPGFSKFQKPKGKRPKNRKYPSKARTPLGG